MLIWPLLFCKKQMKSNLQNRSIYCRDNIDILQGINSQCVDLIYLDPPFNKKKVFTAPIGSHAEGASFKDYFREEDLKEEWLKTIKEDRDELYSFLMGIRDYGNKYNFCYLAYMAIRLLECHRVLKETGSLYLHCDQTMSHYLKILLDCVFGEKNFRNEIVWKRHVSIHGSFQHAPKQYGKLIDCIMYYCKSNSAKVNPYMQMSPIELKKKFNLVDDKGERYYDDSSHIWNSPNMGARPHQCYVWKGYKNPHLSGWRLTKERLEEEYKKGNIVILPDGKLQRRKYEKDWRGTPVGNLWSDINPVSDNKERTGYPTQKPLSLLERIIQASSKKGDLVLDPFCGCATTCIAAEKLGRKWVGIDISIKAHELVQTRLEKEVANPEELFDYKKALRFSTDPPKRTDLRQTDIEQKYVYVISNKAYKNEYKVGIAKDIQKRLNSYQTSDPNRGYKLEYKVLTHNFRDMEKHIHTELQSRHEWVKADLETIKKAMRDFDRR